MRNSKITIEKVYDIVRYIHKLYRKDRVKTFEIVWKNITEDYKRKGFDINLIGWIISFPRILKPLLQIIQEPRKDRNIQVGLLRLIESTKYFKSIVGNGKEGQVVIRVKNKMIDNPAKFHIF